MLICLRMTALMQKDRTEFLQYKPYNAYIFKYLLFGLLYKKFSGPPNYSIYIFYVFFLVPSGVLLKLTFIIVNLLDYSRLLENNE